MSAVQHLLNSSWVAPLGLSLLHFLWQGCLIALAAAGSLYALRNRSANTRYAVACVALALMALAPVVTYTLIRQSREAPLAVSVAQTGQASPVGHDPTARTAPSSFVDPVIAPSVERVEPLSPHMGWLVVGWMAGVLLLLVRATCSWVVTWRWARKSVVVAGAEIQEQVSALSRHMGIGRRVALSVSTVVESPCVIGWLRCVMLLPLTAVTHMPPAQLEALLAHELAHIRRHDYLVNLIQTAIETLLFYHPAVWWVSARIRVEREHCCDDLAVRATGDRLTYARALVTLEAMRSPQHALALAGNGGNLMDRIRRVIGSPSRSSQGASGWLAVAVLFTALIAVVGVARLQASPQDPTAKRSAAPAKVIAPSAVSPARVTPSTIAPVAVAAAPTAPAQTQKLDPDDIIVTPVPSDQPATAADVTAAPARRVRRVTKPQRDVAPVRERATTARRAADVASAADAARAKAAVAAQADDAAQERRALEAEKRALQAEREALRASRQDRLTNEREALRALRQDTTRRQRDPLTRSEAARDLLTRERDELLRQRSDLAQQERERAQDLLRARNRLPLARARRGDTREAPAVADVTRARTDAQRDELMAQIAELRRRVEALERENQRLRGQRERRPSRSNFEQLEGVGQYMMREEQLVEAEAKLSDLRTKYRDQHPEVVNQQAKIDDLRKAIEKDKERLETARKTYRR